ncbi:rubredoxin [Burkholderia gladioli]|uniref:rubredoxin n=1 Tax=Burkholderia gladioli TaxID=28095 RepID=UPI0009BCF946|nr:rubredoxin [Burkholderia gladioli]
MYKKGTALELQFSPRRLGEARGQPLSLGLSGEDAGRLYRALDAYLAAAPAQGAEPLVVSLDDEGEVHAPVPAHALDSAAAEAEPNQPVPSAVEFRQFVCLICGWIYDEASGDPEHGLAPRTRWEAVPDDWRCPLCDVGKEDFALMAF